MSDETAADKNGNEAASSNPAESVDLAMLSTIDRCINAVDETCLVNKFDTSAMIYISVNIAAHLLARGLFCANGPEGRANLKVKMIDNVAEILESAAQHIDQSERELNSKIIRPN